MSGTPYARQSFRATYRVCCEMYAAEPEKRGRGLDRIIPVGKLTYGLLNRVKVELRRHEEMQDEGDAAEWAVCAMVRATIDNTYKAMQAAHHGAGKAE